MGTYVPVKVDHRKGERNHLAKLSEQDVREVRRLYDDHMGLTVRKIAARFGVTGATVSYIGRRKTWKHLPEEVPMG